WVVAADPGGPLRRDRAGAVPLGSVATTRERRRLPEPADGAQLGESARRASLGLEVRRARAVRVHLAGGGDVRPILPQLLRAIERCIRPLEQARGGVAVEELG